MIIYRLGEVFSALYPTLQDRINALLSLFLTVYSYFQGTFHIILSLIYVCFPFCNLVSQDQTLFFLIYLFIPNI